MGYAFQRGEPISAAIPRIVIERIDLALEQLQDENETPAERLHNARKRFKESRAAIRLVRFPLGDLFEFENAWFRDAGRRLAALRDADAMLEAAEELAEYADGYHERRLVRRLRHRRPRKLHLRERIEETVRELPAARERVRLWPALPDDFSTIGEGFRRTFRDGRKAARAAADTPTPESFHEWRKRVKDHWYHLQLLREVWPQSMKSYRSDLESLSDALGDRHDLDVLRETIAGNDFELRILNALIDRRSLELSVSAAEIGRRIYAEPAGMIHDRLRSYWEAW